jgi:hypothetical protein
LVSHIKERIQIEGAVNSFLRRILEPKRDKVEGGSRKLHNEELRNLYSSPDMKGRCNQGG